MTSSDRNFSVIFYRGKTQCSQNTNHEATSAENLLRNHKNQPVQCCISFHHHAYRVLLFLFMSNLFIAMKKVPVLDEKGVYFMRLVIAHRNRTKGI